jgi:hypothetical protein
MINQIHPGIENWIDIAKLTPSKSEYRNTNSTNLTPANPDPYAVVIESEESKDSEMQPSEEYESSDLFGNDDDKENEENEEEEIEEEQESQPASLPPSNPPQQPSLLSQSDDHNNNAIPEQVSPNLNNDQTMENESDNTITVITID